MKKKLTKNGGFTLVEMLIVVAIIAILIAITVPLINATLEKSRHAVDDANYRDAISLANVMYLTEGDSWSGEKTYVYVVPKDSSDGEANTGNNAHQAKLVVAAGDNEVQVSAKCTCTTGTGSNSGSSKNAKLQVVFTPAGTGGYDIAAQWTGGSIS